MINSGGASRKTTEDIMFHPCDIAGVLAVMTAGVMGSVSVAQSAPYDLKWYYDDLVEVKRLDFIVLTDQLEITDVIVNKGNCAIATTFDGAVELGSGFITRT